MHLLLSIVLVVDFAVVVVLGILSVVVDLLALAKHRPPSVFDEVHRFTPSMHRRAARLPRISMQLIDLLKRKNTP